MKKKIIYKGLITALLTPLKDGKIDHNSLANMINLQIKSGASALLIGGSTGEGSMITSENYYDLIGSAAKITSNRVPLIAGVTAFSTNQVIDKISKLNELAIDSILCTPPHYIKPGQEAILQYFKIIAENSKHSIILYSNKGRVGTDFTDNTILKLAENEKIIALKDSSDDIEKPLRLSAKTPSDFTMLAGDDNNAIAYSANGGVGLFSVSSNILPNQCVLLQNYLQDGNFTKALNLQQKLLPLYDAIFKETNPVCVKYACYLLKLCSKEITSPLMIPALENRKLIEKTLTDIGSL